MLSIQKTLRLVATAKSVALMVRILSKWCRFGNEHSLASDSQHVGERQYDTKEHDKPQCAMFGCSESVLQHCDDNESGKDEEPGCIREHLFVFKDDGVQ